MKIKTEWTDEMFIRFVVWVISTFATIALSIEKHIGWILAGSIVLIVTLVLFFWTRIINLFEKIKKRKSVGESLDYSESSFPVGFNDVINVIVLIAIITFIVLLSRYDFGSIDMSWLTGIFYEKWLWITILAIIALVLLISFRKKIFTKKWKLAEILGLLIAIILIWLFILPHVVPYVANKWFNHNHGDSPGSTSVSYESLNTKGKNTMTKGVPKSFQFVFTKKQTYYYFTYNGSDTVTLTFNGNGHTWKRNLWADKKGPHRDLVGTRPQAFAGDCLVSADKNVVIDVDFTTEKKN